MRTGQAAHFGDRAVHSSAPSSIDAAFQDTDVSRSSGSKASANCISAALRLGAGSAVPLNSRASTRRTLVSTTVDRTPKANAATAAAV